jgi:hypothetical protein
MPFDGLGCELVGFHVAAIARQRQSALDERADQLIAVATEHGFPLWGAQGTIYRGWAKVKNNYANVCEKVSSVSSAADLKVPFLSPTRCGLSSSFFQITVVPAVTVRAAGAKAKLSISMVAGPLCEKLGNPRFDRLGQQRTCAAAQDFCQGIAEGPWLGGFDHVTVGHGVSLLHWRSRGVEHHHDTPPNRSHRHQLLAIALSRTTPRAFA